MKDISSFDFIDFQGKMEHQNIIDNFFLSTINSKRLVRIKTKNYRYLFFEITSLIGERGLTILGYNEKDYNFYSEEILEDYVIEEISEIVQHKKVDNIRIPLLSHNGAKILKKRFEKKLNNFIFVVNLNSVSPVIDKRKFSKKRNSYMRQIRKFEQREGTFKKIFVLDNVIKKLHNKRWGKNRSENFFIYLNYMNKKKLTESFGLFMKNKLVAYIQIIPTGDTMHYYYSIFDESYKGSGSAILYYALKEYLENEKLRFFSFGRGAELYKHRLSTDVIKNFELRGFLKEDFSSLTL